ncbi:four-helix bundle copper-binding protein [Sinobaca sp. H24]|uniref:four-helix bundle copper-binding protein n=1 Tax=Sinobaca sp. H24 TaxID=2923376 RepID=UPI00207A4F2E|nr:four-helix bundle copper-binding protein [Sinobaca sp. H24]
MAQEKYEELLRTLHDSMTAANNCFNECLQEDDVTAMTGCIRLARESADICGYLEQAITRKSPFVKELASICATICEACAAECEKHDDDHCQQCAKACFDCAEACRTAA